MNASAISRLTSQSDSLAELQEKLQEELTASTGPVSTLASPVKTDIINISDAAYVKSHSANIMSRNFAGGYTRDTSYLDAQSTGSAAVQNVQNSMQSSLASLVETVSDETAFWYGSERMKNAKVMKDTTESHEEVFAEQKARIEQQAAEAMAPKDESGEPIQQVPPAPSSAATIRTAQRKVPKVEIKLAGSVAAAKTLSSIDVNV